jgi:hypothetical protein
MKLPRRKFLHLAACAATLPTHSAAQQLDRFASYQSPFPQKMS